ncbi:MAG: SGNH/GDSL hydrolase family protein [Verrucomicrobiota bacterium]
MNPRALPLLAALLTTCAALAQQPSAPSKAAAKAAPKSADRYAVRADEKVTWHDVRATDLEGRAFPEAERKSYFDRLPAEADGKVTPAVWSLSRDSAGLMFRFRTDATTIYAHYKVTKAQLAMPHMPATGVSGLDLYARDAAGRWRWVQVVRPATQEMKVRVAEGLDAGEREYALYLPLYNGVEFLSVGVPEGRKFEGLRPLPKPVVFYGTSITHGACASRPGMVHTGILGRRLDVPVVNLGFSGNGRMDRAVGDFLVRIDAAAYVIDCLPNMGAKDVAEKCVPLVKQLRAARPDTPIILVEDRRNTDSWIIASRRKHHDDNHAALKAAYDQLIKEGVQGLSYVPGDRLYGDDAEGATDGSHASDLGFHRQADVLEPFLLKVLGR